MSNELSSTFEYVFPAIAGVQAGRQFFVTMCPLHLIPKIFLFDEEEIVPELRAQRTLNRQRIPEMARYIVNNRSDYVFSALTASVDGDIRFEARPDQPTIGELHIAMSGRFVINDGQHRRAAIEEALQQEPELGNETIGVVLFHDRGLVRSQQMFADLNKYAVRPSSSIGILYDHRDVVGAIAKRLSFESGVFRDLVEMEKTTLSQRSRKLFTLSAIYSANKTLFRDFSMRDVEERELYDLAEQFWVEVAKHIPEWRMVRSHEISASQVRQDFIHSHGIVLQALGAVGNTILRNESDMAVALEALSGLDWHRSNRQAWEGRAMYNGKLSKSSTNIGLTTAYIKRQLGLALTVEEAALEEDHEQNSVLVEGVSG
jgi:DNA sulfur modification protein DndB